MPEYIERGAAKHAADLAFDMTETEYDILCKELDRVPAADVAPVVHGRWIADGDGYHWTYNCSICAWKDGYPFNERHNFCPNCGARMDLEVTDNG